jgi:phosphate uptake regulator
MSIYDYLDNVEHNKADVEFRKVQLTGNSTYIISLPKKWVKSLNLKPGSQLLISKKDNTTLMITPKELIKPLKHKTATVIVSEKDKVDSIIRKIVSLYLIGYNIIRVKSREERILYQQKDEIKNFIRKKLVGAEILSESPNELEVRVLIGYPELSLEDSLRRAYIIAISMLEDSLKALKTLDTELAKEVISVDDEIDRLYLYMVRQLKAAVENETILRSIGLKSQRDCLGYRIIAKFVERIADHAVKIAENVLSLKDPIDNLTYEKIRAMGLFAKNMFEEAINSLYKKDCILADNVIARAKSVTNLEKEFIKYIEGIKNTDTSTIKLITESIRRTAEYASDIAEIVLNINIEQFVQTET